MRIIYQVYTVQVQKFICQLESSPVARNYLAIKDKGWLLNCVNFYCTPNLWSFKVHLSKLKIGSKTFHYREFLLLPLSLPPSSSIDLFIYLSIYIYLLSRYLAISIPTSIFISISISISIFISILSLFLFSSLSLLRMEIEIEWKIDGYRLHRTAHIKVIERYRDEE